MIKEATGEAYGVGPGGMGAVYDTEESNLNEIIQSSLNRQQQNKQLALEQEKLSFSKKKEINDLMNLAKLENQQVLDVDYFQQKADNIRNFIKEGLKAGIDPTDPSSGRAWYNEVMSMVDSYNLDAKVDAANRVVASKALEEGMKPGNDYKNTSAKVDEWVKKGYQKRNKDADLATLVVPVVGSYSEEAQKLAQEINKSGLNVEEGPTKVGSFTAIESTKGLSPEQTLIHAKALMSAHPEKLAKDWNTMGQTMQDYYTKQLQQTINDPNVPKNIKDLVSDMTPAEYWGYTYFDNGIKHERTLKDLKAEPGAEEAAKAKIDYTKGDALYRMIKGFATDNVEYFDNYDKEKGVWVNAPGQPTDELFSTHISPVIIDMKTVDGQPVPVMATQIKKIKNDVNNIFVRTTENGEWTKMPINTFANKAFVFNYKGGADPVEALNALQYMSKKDGTWSGGIVNFTKKFKPSIGVSAGKTPAEVKGGIATPIKSSPKVGEERKVQGGTAVYDGTKWVMKK